MYWFGIDKESVIQNFDQKLQDSNEIRKLLQQGDTDILQICMERFTDILYRGSSTLVGAVIEEFQKTDNGRQKIKANLEQIVSQCKSTSVLRKVEKVDGFDAVLKTYFGKLAGSLTEIQKINLLEMSQEIPEMDTVIENNIESLFEAANSKNLIPEVIILLQEPERYNKEKIISGITGSFDKILTSHPTKLAIILGMIKGISNLEEFSKNAKEHFETILQLAEPYEMSSIIQVVKETNGEEIEENLEEIIHKYEPQRTFQVISDCKGITGIEDRMEECFPKLLAHYFEDNREIDEKRIEALCFIFREVLTHEDLSVMDISKLGNGHDSTSFQLGEYVLKFGHERYTNTIPYDSRILQPILRRKVISKAQNKEDNVYIEVANLVDKNWYREMTERQIEENLYSIYAELRDRGIVWTDIKKENIGRLLKDNKVNFKAEGKEIFVADESVGIKKSSAEKMILKAGELVILDTDYIYTFEDYKQANARDCVPFGIKDKVKDYEIRYEQEKYAGERG